MKNSDEYIEIDLPESRFISEEGRLRLLEAQVVYKGKWRVHLNDPDKNFPSDFHADRVDLPEKLDIYTGQVYDRNTKLHIYSLSRKDMKYIFRELSRKTKEDGGIRMCLNNTNKFEYLN